MDHLDLVRLHSSPSPFLSSLLYTTLTLPDSISPSPLTPDECGIVAQVSAPLAQAEISTYYICTYNIDHTLVSTSVSHLLSQTVLPLTSPPPSLQVPHDSVTKALDILNKHLSLKHASTPATTPHYHLLTDTNTSTTGTLTNGLAY